MFVLICVVALICVDCVVKWKSSNDSAQEPRDTYN